MINLRATLYLLAFPVGFMGGVQLTFALLSYALFNDRQFAYFAVPAGLMLMSAAGFLLLAWEQGRVKVGFKDALLFATLTWAVMGLLGAVPVVLVADVPFVQGVFEAISGLTTTGASVLVGLDDMPRSFLLYRQFLQWMGGLGVVIFVVAVLPMLNVGGMKLMKAETPGPVKDDKLSPRIASTAHYLWLVYFVITLLCALGYGLAGMSAFDAIAHSFSTVATGGMSTYDDSMAHFDNPRVQAVACVFMLLGAISFALHFKVVRVRSWQVYWRDEETRVFLSLVLVLTALVAAMLWQHAFYADLATTLRMALFHVVSFITSSGFSAGDYTAWPPAVALLLVFAGYLGGCAGSTSGGNKIIRNLLSAKLVALELKRLLHPHGVFGVKYQGQPVSSPVLSATLAFMTLAAASSVAVSLALMATGLDFWTAFSAAAACLNVLGAGFGGVGEGFQGISDAGLWVLSGAMILGRLEYFTVIALFLPMFWRR